MFYFSSGSLNELYERGSHFDKSSMSHSQSNTTVRSKDPRPIVHVTDIIEKKDDNGQKVVALKLSDTETELLCLLDQALWVKLFDDAFCLKKGSVITINSYSFVNFLGDKDIINHVLKLKDLSLIGYLELINEDKEQVQNELDKLSQSSSQLVIEDPNTYTVNQLTPKLSSTNWSIKVTVTNKSPVKEFTNRLNGNNGKTMRLQLRDHTGQVEMVVFNDQCERFNTLIINNCYLIRNCEIKFSKAACRAWPNELSIIYDMIATKNSEFEQCKQPFNITLSKQVENQIHDSNTQSPSLLYNKYQKFTPLNELILKQANSFVDVIGAIEEVSDLKSIVKKNKKTLLRNLKIVDVSKTIINVAIWGDEAEQFKLPVGSILVLNNVQLTNYGGISLSVLRASKMIEMQVTNTSSSILKELSMWYRKEWKNVDDIQEDDKEILESPNTSKRKRSS